MDIAALEKLTGRQFNAAEQNEISEHQRRSYRWTFLVSGLTHPKFIDVVGQLSGEGSSKIAAAAGALAA